MRAVVAQLNKLFAEIQNILLKLFKILHIAHGSMQRNFQESENVNVSIPTFTRGRDCCFPSEILYCLFFQ